MKVIKSVMTLQLVVQWVSNRWIPESGYESGKLTDVVGGSGKGFYVVFYFILLLISSHWSLMIVR